PSGPPSGCCTSGQRPSPARRLRRRRLRRRRTRSWPMPGALQRGGSGVPEKGRSSALYCVGSFSCVLISLTIFEESNPRAFPEDSWDLAIEQALVPLAEVFRAIRASPRSPGSWLRKRGLRCLHAGRESDRLTRSRKELWVPVDRIA